MPESGTGLSRCLKCDGVSTVFNSRVDKNGWRWRRRACLVCHHKWTTYEVPAELIEDIRAFLHSAQAAKQHVDALNERLHSLTIVDRDVFDNEHSTE